MSGTTKGMILVVDDDPGVRRLLVLGLQRHGYLTTEAGDGEAALRAVEETDVDLVLLDSGLPHLNGLQVLERLRAAPSTATLPVILVTGRAGIADKVSGLSAGADDYLAKPVALDELIARIEANLRGHRIWVDRMTARLHDRSQLATQLAARSAGDDVSQHIVSTVASQPTVARAALVEISVNGQALVQAVSSPCPPDDVSVLRETRLDLVFTDDFAPLLADGASVVPSGSIPGLGAGRLVAATVGRGSRSTVALVIEIDPSLSDRRDLVRDALGLTVEIAPMVEHMLAQAQPQTALADLAHTLQSVIADDAFHPVFQPICDITTNSVVGYEALTRFDDGTPPDMRFEEASIVGLGADLELATLRTAMLASRALGPSHYLSVNVSATLLGHAALPEILDIADGRQLAIEITEHEKIDDYQRVRDEFTSLGRRLRMAVDDAGSGWASLRHVFTLRPDYVKLDRSWVAGVHLDPPRKALLLGIARSVSEMGGQVIAEGIELEAELAALRSCGIQLGQGYLLGRPSSVIDLPIA